LKIDAAYTPSISILISAYNEERTIGLKLENLSKVIYPKEKIQIVLVNDASSDKTFEEASRFACQHSELDIQILNESERRGKSGALNLALQNTKYDIVVVSDADTFWDSEILIKSLPYLADPTVGAISGRQVILNPESSWVSNTEKNYLDFTYKIIKLGESKIHSTILFHGLFSAYKREFLNEFSVENDDSGTALDIVQRKGRTIYIPEARCYEIFSTTWKTKISTKFRRASQLVQIYTKCLQLLITQQLLLPKKIAVPEIVLYVFNPIIFLLLILTTILLSVEYFPYFLLLVSIMLIPLVFQKTRMLFIEFIQNNFILLGAIFSLALKKRFVIWKTQEESRAILTRELLEKYNLI
jgi:cellulose synthase/poly-beta-1,6-N-acetylglucosamine synthase-like glycosyltransferase